MASNGMPGASGDAGPKRGLPAGRLPSLRGPRDLTLGGVRKKVFAPNLAAVKSEAVKAEVSTEVNHAPMEQATTRGRGRYDRGHDRGRGRGRGRGQDNIVQMKSIFEEKSRDIPKKSDYLPSYRLRGVGGSNESGDYSVKRDDNDEESEQDAKARLNRLLLDDFVDIKHLETEEANMQPVYLSVSKPVKKEKTVQDVKPVVKVKKEQLSDGEDSTDKLSQCSSMTEILSAKSDEEKIVEEKIVEEKITEASQLFTKKNEMEPQMFLIQMPDIIPGHPAVNLSESLPQGGRQQQQRQEKQTASSENASETRPTELRSLSEFSEGLIGKLQIRKSGRMQLVLGETVLDVNLGADIGFLQDVASIRIEDSDAGAMCVLGHVQHKLICVPDVENLLYNFSNAR